MQFSILPARDRSLGRIDFHFSYYRRQWPVVVAQAASHWRAIEKWSPEYLRSVPRSRPVIVKFNSQGVFNPNAGNETGEVSVLSLNFSDAVDLLVSREGYRHYLQQGNISAQFPELLCDLEYPRWIDAFKIAMEVNLWFGGAGCKTPLHFDAQENFLAQILGRKRVLLLPPEQSANLYPALGGRFPHISNADIFSPDLQKFPLLDTAIGFETMLEPGDILYIPKFWWHAVESLDVSISINYWWSRTLQMLLKQGLPRLFSRRGRAEIRQFIDAKSRRA